MAEILLALLSILIKNLENLSNLYNFAEYVVATSRKISQYTKLEN